MNDADIAIKPLPINAFMFIISFVKRIPHKYPNDTPKNDNKENTIIGIFGIA